MPGTVRFTEILGRWMLTPSSSVLSGAKSAALSTSVDGRHADESVGGERRAVSENAIASPLLVNSACEPPTSSLAWKLRH